MQATPVNDRRGAPCAPHMQVAKRPTGIHNGGVAPTNAYAKSQPVIDSRGALCAPHMQDAKRLTGVPKWGAALPHKSPVLQNADNEVTERMKPHEVKH